MAELAQHLGNDEAGQEVRFTTGSAGHEIVRFTEEQVIDLIIMATHGRHGITNILGSTANGVMHRAPCDVLAVLIGTELFAATDVDSYLDGIAVSCQNI